MKITIKEFMIVMNHLAKDISYGPGGTFGDGEKITEKEDYEIALKLIEKVKKGK